MRKKFGYRTLEATYLVSQWPGSTSNAISGQVGRWRYTGQEAVGRALYYGLIENRGTPQCFSLYVTEKGLEALANAWPLFSPDASAWTAPAADAGDRTSAGQDLLGRIDHLLERA